MATAIDRPISAVLQDIVRNIQDLIRSEVRLAKTEVREEIAKARSAAMLTGVGAMAALFSTGFALLALVFALSLVMPQWAAALLVGAALGIVAVVTLVPGIKRFKTLQAPPRAAATLKENVQWAKQLT